MLSNELKEQIRKSFLNTKEGVPNFVVRQSQNKMIAEIAKTLSGHYEGRNNIICVEAPTGTGKTIAYLLSAIPIAKAKNKTLIIASANVALQEQLLFKDIPEIQKHCNFEFDYVLVKGRSRYLCVRNLTNIVDDSTNQNPLFGDLALWDDAPKKHQLEELNVMLDDYSTKKWNGDIDNLVITPEQSLWQKVACNRYTCTSKECDFYQDCAFFKSRRNITSADVIVANHDLVLADLSSGNTVLPNVDESIYIIDEAHNLNQKALSHFSLRSSTDNMKIIIRQTSSVIDQICQLTEQDLHDNKIKQFDKHIDDLTVLMQDLDYDESMHIFENGNVDKAIKSICVKVRDLLISSYANFETSKGEWLSHQKTKIVDKPVSEQINNAMGLCDQQLTSILQLLDSFLSIDDPKQMPQSRWIEVQDISNNNYNLCSAKTDISTNLQRMIWSKAGGVILTSATLTSLGSFSRLNKQLGFVNDENIYLRLPSPFKLNIVDFIVANLKHNPTQIDGHTSEVASELIKRIDTNEGTLVLFASNRQMQLVADLVEMEIDCDLFVQGEFSKKMIIEKHTELRNAKKGSVIFGLDSFAEGVDLRGDLLKHVIIAKLRFSVPTSPIEKTTHEYIKSQNRNPFMEISLPDASLRLVQACGRLIRTESDSGKITIFDNRLKTKFYGKQLLDNLPGYNIIIEK